MKDTFIKRLYVLLKDRYKKFEINSKIRDTDYIFSRKLSVKDEFHKIDFIIPLGNNNDVRIVFTSFKAKASIEISLDVSTGEFNFLSIPSSRIEIDQLYLYAENYLGEIRYLSNNALSFIMKEN